MKGYDMEFMMYFVMFVMFAAGVAITVDCDRNNGTLQQWAIGYACGAVAVGMFLGMVIVSNM